MTPDFWLRIAFGILMILGIWTLFREHMILGWLADGSRKVFHPALLKPLFDCPPCMASVWGTVVWFGTDGNISLWWPAYCLCLCGALKLIVCNILCE